MIKKPMGMWLVLVLAIAILLFAGCAGPPGPAGSSGAAGPAGQSGPPGSPGKAASPAKIVITPPSGTVKTPITILGAGFQPGEEVRMTLMAGSISLDFTLKPAESGAMWRNIANEEGAVRVTTYIPSILTDLKPGVYPVKAVGDKGSVAIFPLEIAE